MYEEQSRHREDITDSGESTNLLDAKAQVMQIAETADDANRSFTAGAVTWKSDFKSLFMNKKSKSQSSGLHTSMASGGSEMSDEDWRGSDKSNSSTMEKLRNFLDIGVFQKSSCATCQQVR